VNAEDVRIVQEEEKRGKQWQFELPFNIGNTPEFKTIVNLLDCVGD
jgi:hypothetical protein